MEDKAGSKEKFYADSYYIRYLIYLNGKSYLEIERKQREWLKGCKDSASYVVLDRRLLRECCEEVKYTGTKEDADRISGELPVMTKRFADTFSAFFKVKPEDVFFDKRKTDEDVEKSCRTAQGRLICWEEKRKELREKRDRMIADKKVKESEKERAEREKAMTGPAAEAARLEKLLVTVLKISDIGYLSRTFEYLADMLHPQTRRFWMEMEKLLSGLNLYLGYQEVIDAGRIKTELGWDYPVGGTFHFQKNEPLDEMILSSLAERQGIRERRTLAEALSTDEMKVWPPRITELVRGESGTSSKKKIAERLGEVLHADWIDMKEEGSRFWTKQGVAVWESAEEQMRQAVRNLKPEDWTGIMNGNGTAAEIRLAVKNVIRFSLCCYEAERNREVLEELEKRAAKEWVAETKGTAVSAVYDLFGKCIRELKEEPELLQELKYKLLMNGMNVELCLEEAFEGGLKEALRKRAEENIREVCREEACTDEERETLLKGEILRLQNGKREEVFEGFRKLWIQAVKKHICPNPWFYDKNLRIMWSYYEDSDEPAVLEETIEVSVYLPEELEKCLDPGEITVSLPYEKGAALYDVICENWFKICEAMDDSFGLELEEWDAEWYDKWKDNVGFESEKVFFQDMEPYSMDNEAIDRMMKDEKGRSRFEQIASIGKMYLSESDPELASDEKECYEQGILLLRREMRKGERQSAEEIAALNERAEET